MSNLLPVIIFTLHVETSPQALPLGAACIASAVRHTPFFSNTPVLLKDMSLEDDLLLGLSVDEAAKKITAVLVAEHPAAVCFSVYVWNRQYLDAAAHMVRHAAPSCVLLAGGPEITANPYSFTSVDYTVAGEGEVIVPQILEYALDTSLVHGTAPAIQGVYVPSNHDDSTVIVRAQAADLALLQSPYLDGTLDPSRYEGALWELARGCPFSCAYCYESKGEKNVRRFSLERLQQELMLFAQKNVGQVFVLDPTYNADRARSVKILSMIQKYAPDIYFNFEVRAEYLDRELARLFASIPCSLQIGLQSASAQVLKAVNRTFDKNEFTKKIGLLNNEGVIFGLDLIYGLPTDTFRGFCDSLDFALNLYPNHLDIFCLSVLPGTTLHDTASSYGLEWQHEAPYHVLSSPSFLPEQLKDAHVLADACALFYSAGRAVSWFLTVLRPLKLKPSDFLRDFAHFFSSSTSECITAHHCDTLPHREIERLQLSFLHQKYSEKRRMELWDAVSDIVKLNGALSRALAEQETTDIDFHWHPEDILGGDAVNLSLFVQEVCRESGTVRVFPGENGPDFTILP